jgi:ATP-dependent Clp protease adapter protein ClpS
MPDTIDRPQVDDLDKVDNGFDSKYAVRALNNDYSTFDNVMGVFIISCGYDTSTAKKYTLEIHRSGSAVCFWNSEKRCKEVVEDFKKIHVEAEVIES